MPVLTCDCTDEVTRMGVYSYQCLPVSARLTCAGSRWIDDVVAAGRSAVWTSTVDVTREGRGLIDAQPIPRRHTASHASQVWSGGRRPYVLLDTLLLLYSAKQQGFIINVFRGLCWCVQLLPVSVIIIYSVMLMSEIRRSDWACTTWQFCAPPRPLAVA